MTAHVVLSVRVIQIRDANHFSEYEIEFRVLSLYGRLFKTAMSLHSCTDPCANFKGFEGRVVSQSEF